MFSEYSKEINSLSSLPCLQIKKIFKRHESYIFDDQRRMLEALKPLNKRFMFRGLTRNEDICNLSSTRIFPSLQVSLICKEDTVTRTAVKEDWCNTKPGTGYALPNYEWLNTSDVQNVYSISSPNCQNVEQNDFTAQENDWTIPYVDGSKCLAAGDKLGSVRPLFPSQTPDWGGQVQDSQLESLLTPADMSLCSEQDGEMEINVDGFKSGTPNKNVKNILQKYVAKTKDSASSQEQRMEHSLQGEVEDMATKNTTKKCQKLKNQRHFGDEDILNEGLIQLEKSFSRKIRECNLNSQSKSLTFYNKTLLEGNVQPITIPLNEQYLKWHGSQLVSSARDPRLELGKEKKKQHRCNLIKLNYERTLNKDVTQKLNITELSPAPSNVSDLPMQTNSSDADGRKSRDFRSDGSTAAGKTASNLKKNPKQSHGYNMTERYSPTDLQNYFRENETPQSLNVDCRSQQSQTASISCSEDIIPGLDLILEAADHFKKYSNTEQLKDVSDKHEPCDSQSATNLGMQSKLRLNPAKLQAYLNLLPSTSTSPNPTYNNQQTFPVNTNEKMFSSSNVESYHTANKDLSTRAVAEFSEGYSAPYAVNTNDQPQNKICINSGVFSEDHRGLESSLGQSAQEPLINISKVSFCCQTNESFKHLFVLLSQAGNTSDVQQKDRKLNEALKFVAHVINTHTCNFV